MNWLNRVTQRLGWMFLCWGWLRVNREKIRHSAFVNLNHGELFPHLAHVFCLAFMLHWIVRIFQYLVSFLCIRMSCKKMSECLYWSYFVICCVWIVASLLLSYFVWDLSTVPLKSISFLFRRNVQYNILELSNKWVPSLPVAFFSAVINVIYDEFIDVHNENLCDNGPWILWLIIPINNLSYSLSFMLDTRCIFKNYSTR